ncbi:MAG: PTS ascorbate transporter subunit IIC [Planctomycetales bacterium]|nr:PTS ascorbate transporter subunit IIC [Planctomycetales bacterium]
MARESFLLRTDPKVLAALRKWAEDELRSANGQIDYLLRDALRKAGRWPINSEDDGESTQSQ